MVHGIYSTFGIFLQAKQNAVPELDDAELSQNYLPLLSGYISAHHYHISWGYKLHVLTVRALITRPAICNIYADSLL